MRLRLGLPVAESLPRWCACNADLRDDPAHFHSCPLLKRTAVTTRHDRLVQLLANLFRTVGAVVHVEQRIFGVNRQRPDLLVITPERSVLVDSPSGCTLSHSSWTRCVARRATRELSTITWQDFRVHRYWPLLLRPSVASARSSGDYRSAQGRPLLIRSISIHRCPQMLAVALQRGNALVARAGALRVRAAAAPRDRQ